MKKFLFLILLIPALAFPQKGYRGWGGVSLGNMLAIISDSTVWHKKGSTPDTILVDGGLPISVTGLKVTGTTTLDGTLSMNTVPTEQVKLGTGSNAAPELSSMADPNTGIRFPGSDTTVFVQGGTRKVTIAPTGKLTVNDSLVTLLGSRNEGGARIKGAATFGATATPTYIDSDAQVVIGSTTTSSGSTVGLVINQGSLDDNVLEFNSSDVAHGMTGETETDVYGAFKKFNTNSGGLKITGLGDSYQAALYLYGLTKGTPASGGASVVIDAAKADGVGTQALADTDPMFYLKNRTNTKIAVLGSGNFGLGTTTPYAHLSIIDAAGGQGTGLHLANSAVNKGRTTWATSHDSASIALYTDTDGTPRLSMKAKDGDSTTVTVGASSTNINSVNTLQFYRGANYFGWDGATLFPGAGELGSLGGSANKWQTQYITDNIYLGGKGQTATMYVSQENTIAGQDSSIKLSVESGEPVLSLRSSQSNVSGTATQNRRLYSGADTLLLVNGAKTGRDSTFFISPSGQATTSGINFYASDGDAGTLYLTTEDELYLSGSKLQINTDNAYTAQVMVGGSKNLSVGSATADNAFGVGVTAGTTGYWSGISWSITNNAVQNARAFISPFQEAAGTYNVGLRFGVSSNATALPRMALTSTGKFVLSSSMGDTTNFTNISGRKNTDSLFVVHNDIVGRDSVFAILSTGKVATTGGVDIATGKSLTVGAVQWDAAASDSINGANIAARTITDLMLPATLTAKSGGVSDADYGDVTVSTGAWAVEDDSHNHTSATTKFVIDDSLRVEETSLLKGTVTTVADIAVGTKAVVNDSLRVEETALLKGDVTANTKLVVNDSLRVEETALVKGAFTANTKAVVNDSLRVEETLLVKGKATFTDDLSYRLRHAFIAFQDSAQVIDVTQNVFARITNEGDSLFVTEEASFVTVAGDSMTVITPGDYWTDARLEVEGGNGDRFRLALFKNGAEVFSVSAKLAAANDSKLLSLAYYLEGLVAGDDLSLRITNLTDSDDPTLTSGTWYLRKEHD